MNKTTISTTSFYNVLDNFYFYFMKQKYVLGNNIYKLIIFKTLPHLLGGTIGTKKIQKKNVIFCLIFENKQ